MASAMQVFVNNAIPIVDRQLVTGKSRHFATQIKMKIIEGGLF